VKTFFKELFHYNHHVNQKLIAFLIENPNDGSRNSIRLLSHIINAHHIWNLRIQSGMTPRDPWEIHQILTLNDMDKENGKVSMQLIDNFDLDSLIQYATAKGQVYNHSVRDLLFNIVNHSTYHRGQIAIEFRQNGMQPFLTDYIFYKMNLNEGGLI
jgi:uncharacterized damage-inducible protein DinB